MIATAKEAETLRRLRASAGLFAANVIGVDLLPFQKRALDALYQHKRLALATAPGVGKTFTAAMLVLHFLTMQPASAVITTGPTGHHIKNILWPEIARLHARSKFPLGGRMNTVDWTLDDGRKAYGISTDQPSAFGGKHPEKLLVVFDDAHGIPADIYEITRDNLMSGDGCHWLLIGNPVAWSVLDFRSAFRPASGFHRMNFSALDHPNIIERREVIPGARSHRAVDEIVERYGVESREYKTGVLGEWADGAEDVLIPLEWFESAASATILGKEPAHMGVDIARQGSDYNVACITQDNVVVDVVSWQTPNLMDSVAKVIEVAKRHGVEMSRVHVDEIGVGGGVVDRLRELGHAVDAVNFGESPAGDWADYIGDIRFKNRRAELLYVAREKIRRKDGKVDARFAEIWRDLSAPWCKPNSAGLMIVQPKDDVKKLIGCSPDFGDAYALSLSRVSSQVYLSWV